MSLCELFSFYTHVQTKTDQKLSVVHRKPQNLRHFQNISLPLAYKRIIDYISIAFCLFFFVTALMVLAEQWPLPAWGHLLPKSLHHVWDACKLSTRYIFICYYPAYRFTVAHMWKHFVNTSHSTFRKVSHIYARSCSGYPASAH